MFLQDYLDEHSFRVVVKEEKNYLTYEGLQDRYAYIFKKVASSKLALFPKTVVNLIYVISTIWKLFHCYVMNIQNLLMHLLIFASNLHKQNFTKSTVFNFWRDINNSKDLQMYVKEYYRDRLMHSMKKMQTNVDEWQIWEPFVHKSMKCTIHLA